MDLTDLLKTCLLDLLHELRGTDIQPLLGGGYGLFLKQRYLQEQSDARTLLPIDTWPAPRATNDLDVFLNAELVCDSDAMRRLKTTLDQLGFVVLESRKYLQFLRCMSGGHKVKVDLLVGPIGQVANAGSVKLDGWRAKPRPSVQLHARITEEALGIEDAPIAVSIDGNLSDRQRYSSTIHVPQAFPYLMMKLIAFRDFELKDPGCAKSQHHALDLYRVVAMMTEQEYETARMMRKRFAESKHFKEAARIVQEQFSEPFSTGSIRIREHPHFTEEMDIEQFLGLLNEVFGTGSMPS